MADDDAALEGLCGGALGDQLDGEATQAVGLVQMDVDADAAPLGDGEDGVEMGHRIAVDGARVDAANDVGAQRHRLVHQLRRPRRRQHPGLVNC